MNLRETAIMTLLVTLWTATAYAQENAQENAQEDVQAPKLTDADELNLQIGEQLELSAAGVSRVHVEHADLLSVHSSDSKHLIVHGKAPGMTVMRVVHKGGQVRRDVRVAAKTPDWVVEQAVSQQLGEAIRACDDASTRGPLQLRVAINAAGRPLTTQIEGAHAWSAHTKRNPKAKKERGSILEQGEATDAQAILRQVEHSGRLQMPKRRRDPSL